MAWLQDVQRCKYITAIPIACHQLSNLRHSLFGILGSALSYAGSYGRVTSEAIGRDLNPLGRGDGRAYVAGALNLGRIAPRLPRGYGAVGTGSSVNNCGQGMPIDPDPSVNVGAGEGGCINCCPPWTKACGNADVATNKTCEICDYDNLPDGMSCRTAECQCRECAWERANEMGCSQKTRYEVMCEDCCCEGCPCSVGSGSSPGGMTGTGGCPGCGDNGGAVAYMRRPGACLNGTMILTVFSFSGIFDKWNGSIEASQCKGKVDEALRAIGEQLENDSNCCNHMLEKWEGGIGYEDWLMTAIRKCLGSDACGHPYVYCTGIDAFDDPNCKYNCKISGIYGSILSNKTLICCNNIDKGLRKSEHCNLVHTILHECLHACKRADLDPKDNQIDDYEDKNPDGIDAQLGKWVDCWCKE